MLLGQLKGSGHPWSNTPGSQKFSEESNGPHNTKSTSSPAPIAFPLSSNCVFWTICISIVPDSPIWRIFHDGLGVVYKQAIWPKLGKSKILEPYKAPPSPQKFDAFSQAVLSGASLTHNSKSTFSLLVPFEKTLT